MSSHVVMPFSLSLSMYALAWIILLPVVRFPQRATAASIWLPAAMALLAADTRRSAIAFDRLSANGVTCAGAGPSVAERTWYVRPGTGRWCPHTAPLPTSCRKRSGCASAASTTPFSSDPSGFSTNGTRSSACMRYTHSASYSSSDPSRPRDFAPFFFPNPKDFALLAAFFLVLLSVDAILDLVDFFFLGSSSVPSSLEPSSSLLSFSSSSSLLSPFSPPSLQCFLMDLVAVLTIDLAASVLFFRMDELELFSLSSSSPSLSSSSSLLSPFLQCFLMVLLALLANASVLFRRLEPLPPASAPSSDFSLSFFGLAAPLFLFSMNTQLSVIGLWSEPAHQWLSSACTLPLSGTRAAPTPIRANTRSHHAGKRQSWPLRYPNSPVDVLQRNVG
mmetsp:Transcript_45816/g.115363  ORF Transcript_45816/g.115363 Transcript_45816/m.115363 type:complete len:390 (+) Transcript_45816:329-1498(+)